MGLPMPIAALVTWLMTAAGGMYLLTIWLIEYDREFQSVAATRLPVPVISSHALLAVIGMVLWAVYLLTGSPGLDWLVTAILAVVAVLGLTMAARWVGVYRTYGSSRGRRARVSVPVTVGAGGGGYGAAVSSRTAVPPERHFPVPVVILHGVFAVVTVVLVVLTTLGHRT
jgi:hypothetical protein